MQVWLHWLLTLIILSLLVYVASAIGFMKMFEKAGEKPWKAWIPVYNTYLLFKLCWKTVWFWPVVVGVAFIAIFGNLKVAFPLNAVFAVLIVVVLIGIIVIRVILANYISKAYGKSVGWTIGLIFLSWLFYLLLGFGKAQFKDAPVPKKPEAKASQAKQTPTLKKKYPDYIDPKPKAKF